MKNRIKTGLILLMIPAVLIATEAFGSDTTVEAGTAEIADMPIGQSETGEVSLLPEDVGENDDLFGLEGGYFHPFISLNLDYTDNLYNIEEGDTDNLLTTVSPGLWFALPRKKVIPVTINPNNSSPGGLQHQFEDYEGSDRFQAYALGGLDFKFYSEDDSLDTTDGILEGLARYNMSNGLSLQLVDRYSHSEDKLERGSSTRSQIRRFNSNFLLATADWDITEKLRLQLDYFNFYLGYEDVINEFLDRVDNGVDLHGYFNYSLTTAFFLEYKVVGTTYDTTTELDNYDTFIFGGVKWDTTDKLSVLFKLGYQAKMFDDHNLGQEDFDGIAYDLQLTYRYSEKTLFELDTYLTNEETDNYLASDKNVLGAKFRWSQKFTQKLSGSLDMAYAFFDYSSLNNVNDATEGDREDTTFVVRPGLQYLFREWLEFELAYRYEYRDSTDDFFDYDSNTVILNVNLAL